MQLLTLAECPQALPTVAQWYYDHWGYEKLGNTIEKEIDNLRAYLNTDCIPLIILGVEKGKVIGAAQLKYHEMTIYPDKEYWLGGVYVSEAYRGRGVAAQIIGRIIEIARSLKVSRLYLQTEQLDGGLYRRLGWRPVEQVNYNGHDVTVMELALGSI